MALKGWQLSGTLVLAKCCVSLLWFSLLSHMFLVPSQAALCFVHCGNCCSFASAVPSPAVLPMFHCHNCCLQGHPTAGSCHSAAAATPLPLSWLSLSAASLVAHVKADFVVFNTRKNSCKVSL